jgi:hypothetical protein
MEHFSLKKIDGKEAYKTKEEAIAKAEADGCGGYHEHEVEGEIFYMPCENHDESISLKSPCWDGYEQIGTKTKDGKEVPNCVPLSTELSNDNVKVVLGSLAKTGVQMNDDWAVVDELDEDSEYSNEDWAGYLIKEKPETTLSKIKRIVGLKDNVTSKNDGSAYSDLDSKNGLYKIRYKYARGMSKSGKSRDFCTQMMEMSSKGTVWRIEDIDRASYFEDVNVEFRHRPSMSYNIFELKGGVFCQHKWVRVLYRLESQTEASKNLGNYKKTRTIPKSYLRSPRGSKKAAIATDRQAGRGVYPK